jgi:hypothetical protein
MTDLKQLLTDKLTEATAIASLLEETGELVPGSLDLTPAFQAAGTITPSDPYATRDDGARRSAKYDGFLAEVYGDRVPSEVRRYIFHESNVFDANTDGRAAHNIRANGANVRGSAYPVGLRAWEAYEMTPTSTALFQKVAPILDAVAFANSSGAFKAMTWDQAVDWLIAYHKSIFPKAPFVAVPLTYPKS